MAASTRRRQRAVLERELLRERAAPRHAEHVDALVPELVEKPRAPSRASIHGR